MLPSNTQQYEKTANRKKKKNYFSFNEIDDFVKQSLALQNENSVNVLAKLF